MPPKRKAAEPATERTTKTRRANAKEAKSTKPAPATKRGAKENTYTEQMERLCTDASVPMDGALPLLIAWSVNAKTLGTITRAEFTDWFGKLKIDTPQKMALMASDLNSLFFGCNIAEQASRMSLANNGHGVDSYDCTQLRSYQRNAESAYSKFYSFCFVLVKPPQSRNIDMETATAFWSVILAPKYPIAGELLDFINEKGTYKAVTKDLWGMMLEFCRTVQPDLSGYDEEEAAWPTLLDDFIEWKKAKSTGQNGDAVMAD
ncbi:unnamed protein product [Rhizoctonia solani]|uniref:Defective in cullin neddylation protein n=1 Tax=Rhizoctonia solani TaxID=456999 RepID=A0A8H3AFH7_9AGAM|nr:unnamed protein product [Rhizoctonia solani]